MKVSLTDTGKRFNREWIFRHLTYTFESGNSYAITGPNGSGKSTLLQAISGAIHINEGNIRYEEDSQKPEDRGRAPEAKNREVSQERIYNHVSICAPYLEVVEEMNLQEFLAFHHGFKPFLPGITIDEIISAVDLAQAATKQIRYYSSGMKQRVKLAQCIYSDSAIVLLDEPCTNLDVAGITLYHQLINDYCSDRLVVVSSNDEVEYKFCKEKLSILDFK